MKKTEIYAKINAELDEALDYTIRRGQKYWAIEHLNNASSMLHKLDSNRNTAKLKEKFNYAFDKIHAMDKNKPADDDRTGNGRNAQ